MFSSNFKEQERSASVRRRIFGPKRGELTEKWRKLRTERQHNLFSLSDVIIAIKSKTARWAGRVKRMREMRNISSTFAGKSEGKILLRRLKQNWEANIKVYIMEIYCKDLEWIQLVLGRVQCQNLVITVMKH
jgi:hypothetical protein